MLLEEIRTEKTDAAIRYEVSKWFRETANNAATVTVDPAYTNVVVGTLFDAATRDVRNIFIDGEHLDAKTREERKAANKQQRWTDFLSRENGVEEIFLF